MSTLISKYIKIVLLLLIMNFNIKSQNSVSQALKTNTVTTPSICEVTVDDLSIYNEIYWQKTLYPTADSFFVYREVSPNIFSKIGGRSAADSSMFIDTVRSIGTINGDPNISSNKYKIQLKDNSGNYSALSLWHQTIFINDQQNSFFDWNAYAIEGTTITPVSDYNLQRRDLLGILTLIGNTTGLLLNDLTYALFWPTNVTWYVDATGFSCDPLQKIANPNGTMAQKVKTKSNHANDKFAPTKLDDLNSISINTILVYPNPAKDNVTIQLSSIHENMSIELTDIFGQTLIDTSVIENRLHINTSNYTNGIYFIMIKHNNKAICVKKIVLHHS